MDAQVVVGGAPEAKPTILGFGPDVDVGETGAPDAGTEPEPDHGGSCESGRPSRALFPLFLFVSAFFGRR